ncbi:hypothetical protein D3C77_491080 [compost metagenome]
MLCSFLSASAVLMLAALISRVMKPMPSASCRLLSPEGRRRAVSAGMTRVMADIAVKCVATIPPAISRLAPYFMAWCRVPLPCRK